jgi:hypothetical protein
MEKKSGAEMVSRDRKRIGVSQRDRSRTWTCHGYDSIPLLGSNS